LPEGSAVGIVGVVGRVYASGRVDREWAWERERRSMGRERGRDRSMQGASQSVSPDAVGQHHSGGIPTVQGEMSKPRSSEPSGSTLGSASGSSSSSMTVVVPASQRLLPEAPSIPKAMTEWEEEEEQWTKHPTPANSPVISLSATATKLKPALTMMPSPHTTTSYYAVSPADASISWPNVSQSPIALQGNKGMGRIEGDGTIIM
jgi:hypothetical protein